MAIKETETGQGGLELKFRHQYLGLVPHLNASIGAEDLKGILGW